MATLAELIARKEALEAERASPIKSSRHGEMETSAKPDFELKAALRDIDRQIALATSPPSSPFVSFTTSKGL